MKRSMIATGLILSVGLLAATAVQAQNNRTDWALFSKALKIAVAHENNGVKLGALQQIAIYGSHLDVDGVVFDIVRVYRNSKDENERILALSALAKMNNAWAIDFLSRSVRFERSERVRSITIDVVNQYRLGRANSESAKALAIWEAHQVPPSSVEIEALLAAD